MRLFMQCHRIVVVVGMVFCAGVPAHAQGLAVRGGVNVNPDQFYGGGQYELGPVIERIWLQPNVDLGWGDDATLVAANFDVAYRRPLQRNGIWMAYLGGGPAINWYHLDAYSATEMGVGIFAGLRHSHGWFTDFRVGFFNSPRFRLGVGYAFGARRARAPRRR